MENIFERAESLLGSKINLDLDAKNGLFKQADGDGRTLLNLIENISWKVSDPLTVEDLSVRLSKN